MKNTFFKFFAIAMMLFSFSCSEHDDFPVFEESLLHFQNETETAVFYGDTQNGDHSIAYYVTNKVNSTHAVELVFDPAASTAVLGTHFTIVKVSDELTAGEANGDFTIKITPAGAGKKAVFTIKSNSLVSAGFKEKLTVTFSAVCPSQLAGTYQYSTVNYYSPDTGIVGTTPVTGSVTIGTTSTTGLYSLSDASFGGYKAMYGGSTIASNVKLQDLCNKLSFSGANQYGDTHSISNVVVNGDKLTFKWSTSYGEYGTTTLTKSAGSWPALY